LLPDQPARLGQDGCADAPVPQGRHDVELLELGDRAVEPDRGTQGHEGEPVRLAGDQHEHVVALEQPAEPRGQHVGRVGGRVELGVEVPEQATEGRGVGRRCAAYA
jgi:hypothetical protein